MSRIYTAIAGEPRPSGAPRHDTESGESAPGAADLRDTTDAAAADRAEAAWRDHARARDHDRSRFSSNNPHLNTPFSPLQALVHQALRRYGDMHPGTIDGEVGMMFLEFANLVIEDLRVHPYWDNPEIDYYLSLEETRPIPDAIVLAGLLYQYAMQQQSAKVESYGPAYFRTMNSILYGRRHGSGRIEMSPFDSGQRAPRGGNDIGR